MQVKKFLETEKRRLDLEEKFDKSEKHAKEFSKMNRMQLEQRGVSLSERIDEARKRKNQRERV